MKLRSHEILSTPATPTKIRPSNPSKFKQLFQRKNLFKKQQPTRSANLIHHIPDYVRKSIFRFLLEVKTSASPPPPTKEKTRAPPVMGVQALKTKKQLMPPKRSSRIKQQQQPVQPVMNNDFDDYQSQQDNYDMTILHLNIDDDCDESVFASQTSTNQKKPIPEWARRNELQIALCNQLYFHRNPSEIFGNAIDCSSTHLREILHSMLPNVNLFDDNQHQSPVNSNKSILV